MPWNQLWPTSCTVAYSGFRIPGRLNTESPPVVTRVGYSMRPPPPPPGGGAGAGLIRAGSLVAPPLAGAPVGEPGLAGHDLHVRIGHPREVVDVLGVVGQRAHAVT